MNAPITLPDSLREQIRSYELRLKRMETWWAVAGGFVGLFVTLVLLYLLDRFVDTPKWGRFLLLVSGVLGAAYFARRWAHHWLFKKRGPGELAKMLGKHFRTLGDRLQGVVELSSGGDLPPNMSEALCRAAIAQVAEESRKHAFAQAVPVKPTRRWVYAGGAVALVLAMAFIGTRRAATNAVQRWALPLADVERYTFAGLEELPRELVVPHGEPFELAVKLRADSEWRPRLALAQIEQQDMVIETLENGAAVLKFPGQTKEGSIELMVGDAQKAVVVRPMLRPELKALQARVALPAYLEQPEKEVKVSGSGAEFVAGSWLTFVGEIGRSLGGATMEAPGASRGLFVEGNTFRSAPRLADEIEGKVEFSWKDEHGMDPVRPYVLKVATVQDAEPKVELVGLDPELALLPGETLPLDLAATDDFGIREAWLEWTMFSATGEKKELGKGALQKIQGGPEAKEIKAQVQWSAEQQLIPEDTLVELAARSVDYYPGRTPATSWKHTILIMSPAKHAERIRDRMDSALKVLDDRIRDEETNLEQTKQLEQKLSEAKEGQDAEKNAEKLKELAAEEQKNKEELNKTSEEMEDILSEALRNKEVPEDTLADWKKLSDQLKQKADPAMEAAAQKMQQASQQPQQEEQQKELADAKQEQQKALDAMKEAAEKMDQVSENLFAKNFYNRLKHASQQENAVADGMKKLARETAGLLPEEIDPKSKELFNLSATKQEETVKGVEEIIKDMSVFIVRLPNEKYQKVRDEMESQKTVPALTELAKYVRSNLGLKSVGQARDWGKRLEAWAEMLREKEEGQQGEGEPQEIPPEMMELMIAIVRTAQAQDTLREMTLGVEKLKYESLNTLQDANKVADQQAMLTDSVHQLLEKTPVQEAKPLLSKVEQLMSSATAQLRFPRTDEETTGLQSTIIELLVPPDKKQDPKDQQKKQSKMKQMQQAAAKMMQKAKKPGRSAQGGGGSLVNEDAQGVAVKDKQNMRTVEKGGGASGAGEWPAEFRDQLQQYFNRIETEAQP
jgi:hypothetical protein